MCCPTSPPTEPMLNGLLQTRLRTKPPSGDGHNLRRILHRFVVPRSPSRKRQPVILDVAEVGQLANVIEPRFKGVHPAIGLVGHPLR